jgi:DNA polymerase zeta
MASFERLGLPQRVYKSPYYSNEDDAPERPSEFSGLVYRLRGESTLLLEDFTFPSKVMAGENHEDKLLFQAHPGWEYASLPPSRKLIKDWLQHQAYSEKEMSTNTPRSQVRLLQFHSDTFMPLIFIFG